MVELLFYTQYHDLGAFLKMALGSMTINVCGKLKYNWMFSYKYINVQNSF